VLYRIDGHHPGRRRGRLQTLCFTLGKSNDQKNQQKQEEMTTFSTSGKTTSHQPQFQYQLNSVSMCGCHPSCFLLQKYSFGTGQTQDECCLNIR